MHTTKMFFFKEHGLHVYIIYISYIENNVGYVPKHLDNQYGYCSGNVNGSTISTDDDLIKVSNKECYSNAYVK